MRREASHQGLVQQQTLMRKIHYLVGLMLLMAGTATTANAQVSNDNEDEVYKVQRPEARDYVPGEVLFKLRDGQQARVRRAAGRVQSAGISALDKVLQEFGAEDMEQLLPNARVTPGKARRAKAFNGETIVERDLTQLYRVQLSEERLAETMLMVERLKELDEVEFAEPNYKMYIMADDHIADSYSGNGYASQQWYLDAYGVTQLWTKPIVNPTRPVIAIIDTGVDLMHPDLVDNLWTNTAEAEGEANYDNDGNGFKGDVHGWDFINNTPAQRDNNMHGTHVAGIAAASNNGIGIVGANPRALIMPVTVMQSDGTGDVATIIKGINYAVSNGATVLNLSLGTYANSSALRQALERAYQTAVIVAAAGNDGLAVTPDCSVRYAQCFPAAYSFVLGVQATTSTGTLAGFSNYDCDGPNFSSASTLQDPDGFNYELRAPGANILSTIPGGKYKALNGTSMASPLVAGAISALKMVKEYDTQEILWGDLLHTSNIAEAYAVENRPAELDLMKIQLRNRKDLADETEADYSGDYEIDAGEIVSVYPVIRTTFGEASNIKMHLEMGDEFEDASTVEIYNGADNKVDFGMHLDAYGRGVSLNPLEFKVASNVADARHIKMKLVATCDESTETYEMPFVIVVTNMVKINGLITEDRTLTADHTYYVNDNLAVNEGATLTIEPGARLEFATGMKLSSFGKLVAKGTPEKPIVFTRHTGEGAWYGIASHQSTGKISHAAALYTNADRTLFTLLPTEATPERLTSFSQLVYYNSSNESSPGRYFNVSDYIEEFSSDFTDKQGVLTDPDYLTPSVLQALSEYKAYCAQYPSSAEKHNSANVYFSPFSWETYDNPRDTISYCRIEGDSKVGYNYMPYMKDCVIDLSSSSTGSVFNYLSGVRNTLTNLNSSEWLNEISRNLRYSNIINNYNRSLADHLPSYNQLYTNNYFNNRAYCTTSGKYYKKDYWLGRNYSSPTVDKADHPSYLGTSREDIVRPYIWELGNAPSGYGSVDLSNMRTTPVPEAHGIVWKVVVNGKDAQDEYEDLTPLGVGKHKFDVYFNRPMNKAVAPNITFGVRDPYTQNGVNEDGSWNDEGTIYTAYKTITGKTKSDGVNRIYVYGAEDNEYFEIPYEKSRFNINVQAAGSMATGFMAEAGLGKVSLTWNNENNDFDDAMGFNIYRYTLDAEGNEQNNTRINTDIVDIETTDYTDYDVTPGTTYYYIYKVLSTDLQEYDMSNVVAATPLTSSLGDANGSGDVDVADVITTVNYAAGMEPKPFIFEAADMNSDQLIDILDVIGIIQKILHPEAAARTMADGQAVYTIEDGTLYVESDVALAGVQVQLSLPQPLQGEGSLTVAQDLKGFEHVSAWLSDNDYLFMAYNLNGQTLTAGKHALLHIGDAQLNTLRLSDAAGHNVRAIAGDDTTTAVDRMGRDVMTVRGVYDLQGRKLSSDGMPQQKGIYIVNGEKVVR